LRILLIGKNGQVGWELQRTLLPFGDVTSVDFPEIDLAEPNSIKSVVRAVKPTVIINAAAYTDVEKAESEPELANAVNGTASGHLAEEAKAFGAILIHYSTDYVFDGEKRLPYTETDVPNPINTYGKSKLLGEQAIQDVNGDYLILRTSWVYSLRKGSFVTKVMGWARNNRELRIVSDQVANPTWCRLLADVTVQLLAKSNSTSWLKERKGLYHLAGAGHTSRFDFTKAIVAQLPPDFPSLVETIVPASSGDFQERALRPHFSALDIEKFAQTFGFHIPTWEKSLQSALSDFYVHE
jgi:dTDP-4-dehydrorhamnose reductase